ncbi:MAG: hypothetical protein R2852_01900 [Bacteroidia bacterium]
MSNIQETKKYTIKFGTDGWREIIADNYTVENVSRVAHATALWMKEKHRKSELHSWLRLSFWEVSYSPMLQSRVFSISWY